MMNDDVRIIHGDAEEELAKLEGRFALVTDPPYGIKHQSNHGASWQGAEIHGDDDERLRDFAIGWAKGLGISWAAFGNWKCQRPPGCRGVLIWDKGPAFGMGDLGFPWKPSWEEVYIGGPDWKGPRDEGVIRGDIVVSWESKGRKHQHQKPVTLMRKIIDKLPPDLTIVDPFAGTGSTLVAAMKAGRKAIGIEIDAKLIPLIERRIAGAETPLFGSLRP